jgi:outer membrane protein TolC
LDLPTAQSLAGVRSDEVAIRQAEQLAAQADMSLAKAARILPLATATLVAGPVPGARGNVLRADNSNRSLADLGPFGRIDVEAVQPLWTWGQLDAARDAAAAGIRARELMVQDIVSQIHQRVRQLYFGAALAKKLLDIAGDVDKALAQVDEKIAESEKAKDGEISQEDKYRVALFRSELEQRRADATKGLHLARVALAATLAMPEPQLRLSEASLQSPENSRSPSKEEALAAAELARPDLKALDQAILAREAEVHATGAALLPQAFLAGKFTYSYAPNRDIQFNPWVMDEFNALFGGVVVGLRQNLAIGLLLAQRDKADAQLTTLKRQRAGLSRLVSVEVEQAIADLEAARTKNSAARAALSAGKSWFRSAGLNFTAGVADAKALIDAYTGYVKTQIDQLQSTYEYLVAEGRLEQVMGKAPSHSGAPTCTLP